MSNFLVGTNLADVALDKFNGDTSTVAFTLSVPSSTFSALVRISGVVQTPVDDYNISGTSIVFTSSPPLGTENIVVTYTKAPQVGVPNDASVSSDKLASNAVTTAKILDANITTSKILDANITTSKLQDNSVSLSKLAGGTADKFLGFDSSGNPAEKSVVIPATAVKIVEMTASADGTNASQYSPQPFRFNTFVFGSASDFNTTTHKFLPTGGIYHCYFSGLMSVGGTGFMHVRIDVNTLRDGYVEKASGHTTDLFQHSAIMAFASGEEVWWTAYGSSGSTNKPLASKAHLIIHKLG